MFRLFCGPPVRLRTQYIKALSLKATNFGVALHEVNSGRCFNTRTTLRMSSLACNRGGTTSEDADPDLFRKKRGLGLFEKEDAKKGKLRFSMRWLRVLSDMIRCRYPKNPPRPCSYISRHGCELLYRRPRPDACVHR